MFKFILFVTLVLQLLLQSECLFSGESCIADGEYGTCTLLLECTPLVAEIRQSGNPMPTYMRNKLQRLTCGYDLREPLVCCLPLTPTITTEAPDWGSNTNWGGNNNWAGNSNGNGHSHENGNSDGNGNSNWGSHTNGNGNSNWGSHTNGNGNSNWGSHTNGNGNSNWGSNTNEHGNSNWGGHSNGNGNTNGNSNSNGNGNSNWGGNTNGNSNSNWNGNSNGGGSSNWGVTKPSSTVTLPTTHIYNLIDSGENTDNVEPYTRRPTENKTDKKGPPNVEQNPKLALLPQNCGSIEDDRIWGGNRTRLYEMPWMVLLSYDSGRGLKLACGGTIINQWYVLTAAHCVSHLGDNMRLDGVILGEYDVRTDPDCEITDGVKTCAPKVMNVSIASVTPHPGYTPQSLTDDIALIRLSEPANFKLDSVKPICLPINRSLQTQALAGVNGVVAGWGVTEEGLQSPVLLSVDLPIVSYKDCNEDYNGTLRITKKQLCAGGVKDKDSCGGDSGGPLMYPGKYGTKGIRYVQRGIVSYGTKRCGLAGYPGVYTNVAYYMDWILDHIHN